jgi:DNA primase
VTESGKGNFDRFRDRVIFPIINTNGKIIGFGGRELEGGEPKYLNSAESSIFLKKNNLFGLNLTRQEIGKEGRAILVEGYMDVISLYQHGVRNVTASLGTALTSSQAKLLKRYAPSVTIAYDADQAGQTAALRGGEILYAEGLKVRIARMPHGKDPDDYIREHKKAQFMELLDAALPYVEYKLDTIKEKYDLEDTEAKLDFIKEAVAFLKTLSPATAEMYIKTIAKNTKISESAILLEYSGNAATQTQQGESVLNLQKEERFEKPPDELEKNLLRLCLSQNDYFQKIKAFENVFVSRQGIEIFQGIEAQYSQKSEIDLKSLTDMLDEGCAKLVQNILENIFLAGKEEQIFDGCVKKLKIRDLKELEKEIVLKLSLADEILHKEQVEKLTKEFIEVQREIQNIKQ